MTALPPIEGRLIRGVSSQRHPLNDTCSHPDCSEPAVDPHHIFPRSSIGNDSWFVEIEYEGNFPGGKDVCVIPHVTGLCRAHHDDVEEHRAWIKLEDGKFVWYDQTNEDHLNSQGNGNVWQELGAIDPQPAGREKAHKKRKKFQGQKRRERKTISIRVPNDAGEDGAGLLEDAIASVDERLGFEEARPPYFTLMDALSHVILNTDETDV